MCTTPQIPLVFGCCLDEKCEQQTERVLVISRKTENTEKSKACKYLEKFSWLGKGHG